MRRDPGQRTDIAEQHPDVVERLRAEYERWWKHISDRFDDYVRIELGAPQANPAHLTCHDWHTNNKLVPWNQRMIARDPQANGFWAVHVARAGRYRFTLRARPDGVPYRFQAGTARLRIGQGEVSAPIRAGSDRVVLEATVPEGDARLQTWLEEADGRSRGAYFVEVERHE